jgi:hypothetical protein
LTVVISAINIDDVNIGWFASQGNRSWRHAAGLLRPAYGRLAQRAIATLMR